MDIKYEVIFTGKAKKDLKNIYKYISKKLKENDTAQELMKIIEQKILVLEDIPEGFCIIEFYKKRKYQYRRIGIKNYEAIYRIDKRNKIVYVVRIVYGARDYLNKI